MALTLTLRQPTTIPLDLRELVPSALAGLDQGRIERWPLVWGGQSVPLGELFQVRGDADHDSLVLEGDLAHVTGVGASLAAGEIRVCGSVGSRVGVGMQGGQLWVEGNAADQAGLEMQGGLLVIEGNVGHDAGAAAVGRHLGMRGGTLIVRGRAGDRVGCRMRRGVIAVAGDCGALAAWEMKAGTVCIGGAWGSALGVGMRRGTIVLATPHSELPPYFAYGCRTDSVAWRLMERHLERHAFELPVPRPVCDVYVGDRLEGGRGELLVAT